MFSLQLFLRVTHNLGSSFSKRLPSEVSNAWVLNVNQRTCYPWLTKQMPLYVLAFMSPNKVGTWVRATIGPPSWNLFAQIQCRNKEDFKLFLTTFLWERVLQWPMIPRQIIIVYQGTKHSMKSKRSAITKPARSFQPSWNKTYPWLQFIEGKMNCEWTCVSSNSSVQRLANLHLP